MARPGFYNDNQYRDYPFIAQPTLAQPLPTSAIVDAGFTMGYDAVYNDQIGAVFLREIQQIGGDVRFVFLFAGGQHSSNAITFSAPASSSEYTTVFQDSATIGTCGNEPLWRGFIVVGALADLLTELDIAGGTLTFAPTRYVVEPARIQNLNKAYLRSISVGNRGRITVPMCGETGVITDQRAITADCMQGPIIFEEGYQTSITQVTRENALLFSAQKTAGDRDSTELCENQGEIPFYPNEVANKPYIHGQVDDTPPRRSEFLSGGWACKDLIFTVNGLGGSNVNIIGGQNIQVGYDTEAQAIKLTLAENARGRCNG